MMGLSWGYLKTRGQWRLRYRGEGLDKSFLSSEKNEKKARKECERKLLTWERTAKTKSPTIEWVLDEYLRDKENRIVSSSLKSTKSILTSVLFKARKKELSKMQKADWQELIDDKFGKETNRLSYVKATINRIIDFCRFASAKGWLEDSKVPIYFHLPKCAEKIKKKALTAEDIKALFLPSDCWHIHALRFLLLTGLRRGELCALRLDRDYNNGIIHVQESYDGTATSKGKTKQANRFIALGEQAKKELEAHLKRRQERGTGSIFLFCSKNGKRVNPASLLMVFKHLQKNLGFTSTLHELRHTYITYAVKKSDQKLEDLKAVFGHSASMNTEAIYVHELERSQVEIEENVQKLKIMASKIEEELINF